MSTLITTHLEIVLVTLLSLLMAVVVLQQRRSPQSAVAWLLFMIVVPYVALPLFLLLGFRKQSGRFAPIVFIPEMAAEASGGAEAARLDQVFHQFGLPAATPGHDFTLLADPVLADAALSNIVETATDSIDVLFYIVADDPVGVAFVKALTRRSQEGVKVRLLLDRFGSLRPPRRAIAGLKAAGGEVRFFSPLIQRPGNGKLNLRNHRKMVIADGMRVFSGGMNVGQDYLGPEPSPGRWNDLGFDLTGPAVANFEDIFISDWEVAGGVPERRPRTGTAPQKGDATVQVVPAGPDLVLDPLHDGLVQSIHAARKRVWIVTPYFLPTELLGNALTIAARRGVDVQIVLPRKSNQRLADFARGAYLREMEDAGCKVLLWQPGMIHAKAGLIDDVAFVGSANFDVRSMLLNFEVDLFVYDVRSVATLESWFLDLLPDCRAGAPRASFSRRVAEGVFRLGAPVL